MSQWTVESLVAQGGDKIRFIFVSENSPDYGYPTMFWQKPKPTVWSGPYRLTKEDWWSKSNSLNTGLCLVQTEWVAFLDDRSVLMPGWLNSIADAMRGNYAVFGTYEKRKNMQVVQGAIIHPGEVTGIDHRVEHAQRFWGAVPVHACGGEWAFGCNIALPTEWALQVNGFDETCDGISCEDCMFGLMLQNNGFDLRFDSRMKMIEDRTPELMGKTPRREDKGVSPNDKSHALLAMLKTRKEAKHTIHLRTIIADLKDGKPWPAPWGPTHDFFDNQPISEL